MSGYIFAIKARIDNREENLLSTNISFTCPRNMVNLARRLIEIHPVVWGTPITFNGFRVLAALHARHSSIGRQHTLRRCMKRWRHLYSAVRPSRRALLVICNNNVPTCTVSEILGLSLLGCTVRVCVWPWEVLLKSQSTCSLPFTYRNIIAITCEIYMYGC